MQGWIVDYVQGLSPAEYHLQVGILVIVMCVILYKTYQTYHRLRYISDTATSRIASAAQGYVELKGLGELMPGSNISSPFSQQRCLWYQCIVEKRERLHSDDSYDWREISNESSEQLFHLQDETGACVIFPEGAVVTPSQHRVWYGSSEQARYHGPRKAGRFSSLLGSGKYRFTEKLIRVADPLYAIGFFETQQKIIQDDAFKHQVEGLLEQWRARPEQYLADYQRDEQRNILQQEWLRIRRKAESEVRARQPDDVHHLLKKPLDKSQPFLISALSEDRLLARKSKQIFFQLALFFLLLYVLLSAINAHSMVTQN